MPKVLADRFDPCGNNANSNVFFRQPFWLEIFEDHTKPDVLYKEWDSDANRWERDRNEQSSDVGKGGKRPGTFDLLGSTHYWDKTIKGN